MDSSLHALASNLSVFPLCVVTWVWKRDTRTKIWPQKSILIRRCSAGTEAGIGESALLHQASASGDWEKHSVGFLLNNPSYVLEGLYCNRARQGDSQMVLIKRRPIPAVRPAAV